MPPHFSPHVDEAPGLGDVLAQLREALGAADGEGVAEVGAVHGPEPDRAVPRLRGRVAYRSVLVKLHPYFREF